MQLDSTELRAFRPLRWSRRYSPPWTLAEQSAPPCTVLKNARSKKHPELCSSLYIGFWREYYILAGFGLYLARKFKTSKFYSAKYKV
jgi:hypothetical protein